MSDTIKEALSVAIEGGIAVLTIECPSWGTPSIHLLTDFSAALSQLAARNDVRVVILQSAHPGVFCTTVDLRSLSIRNVQGNGAILEEIAQFHGLLRLLSSMPTVTIAKIAGLCRGCGRELALACDLRYAATGITRIGLPEATADLIPGGGGTQRLTHLVGLARTKEIVIEGDHLTAEEAEHLGWINRALPPEHLDAYVDGLAARVAGSPEASIEGMKRSIDLYGQWLAVF